MTRARKILAAAFAAALLCCAAPTSLARAQAQPRDDAVVRATRDEMARTMSELRLEKADRPYFVAYTVTEHEASGTSASFGSLVGSHQGRSRTLSVEVRVGDYAFDNTNFFSMPGLTAAGMRTFMGVTELPLDDDYLEIRRQIWLATDGAYKQAVEALAGKRAALLNRTQTDSLPDFTKAEVTHTTDELRPAAFDLAAGEVLVRELSKAGSSPNIYSSSVSLSASNSRIYYVNSEGTTYVRSRPMVTFSASASTQAADGMPLSSSLRIAVRSMDALPDRDQLSTRVHALFATLDTVRNAPVIDRYNGPVLFEGRAAAELFSEQFAPALAANRKPVSNNPAMERMAAMLGGSSQRTGASLDEKLGARVLPAFLSVVDDPTIAERGPIALFGGYAVDDQGVRAHPTRVIDGGILKTFLSGRTPVPGVASSTGNFRGGRVSPSNLIVEATDGLSDDALRERLLSLAKTRGLPYAIIVRSIGAAASDDPATMVQDMMSAALGGGGTAKGRNVFRAYKLFADGHEECVRGAQLVGIGVDSFKEIVAASSSTSVLHGSAASSGLSGLMQSVGSGPALASFVVPSLLFDDLTITKRPDELPKPPISAPPVAPR
jgi:hypothetical protein